MMRFINFIKTYQRDVVFGLIAVLIFISGYNIGKIVGVETSKPKIEVTRQGAQIYDNAGSQHFSGDSQQSKTPASKPAMDFSKIQVVGSKNSDKYHFPWCLSVSRIKDENKIVFANEQEAITSGYTLAGNCTK